ncbi:MAG: nonstructural protein [Microvirus sp.]|nr:MAG: nonstructural protein [Microvirus sp.]
MKLLVISVRDSVSGAFTQPSFVRSKGEAIRSFSDAVGSKDSGFCAHPADYTLYYIGEFDDLSGEINGLRDIEKLITGAECQANMA